MNDILVFGGTLLSIHLISTVGERLFIFAVIVLILYKLSKRLVITRRKWFVSVAVAGALTLLCSIYLTTTILVFIPAIFIIIVLILFLFSMGLTLAMKKKLFSAIVAGIITFSVSSKDLTDFHRTLFVDPAVVKFGGADLNSLALDIENRILYASGHGSNHLHAYNIDALNVPPRLSEAETGHAQGFFYNTQAQEIYIYEQNKQRLDILDSTSLTLRKSIPFQISPGDIRIEHDPHTGSIIIASEGDIKRGDNLEHEVSTVVVNRADGKVVKELSLHPGNILLHPIKPLLYMSHFKGVNNEIIIYDLEMQEIAIRKLINTRLSMMAFLESVNELLVAAPTKSIIYRLDANTLTVKGQIKTSFGVRTMAVDTKRNLLLAGSLVTNILDVIDLNTYQSIEKYYLGPWLRAIVLDGNGTAYVSGFTGLFRVNYAKH